MTDKEKKKKIKLVIEQHLIAGLVDAVGIAQDEREYSCVGKAVSLYFDHIKNDEQLMNLVGRQIEIIMKKEMFS